MRLPYRHLLVSVLFVAPLALGSFHPWAVAVLCVVAGLSALLLVLEGHRTRLRVGLLGLGLAALLVYTLLQLIPLPPSITGAIWDEGHEIWRGALALAPEAGTWHPLSLEPMAGIVEAAKLALLLCVALVSGWWVWSSGPRSLLTAVALAGAACAVVALFHRLSGIEAAYGLYQPLEAGGSWLSAPLLNRNHLTGLMALCAPITIGLALEEEDRARRILWILTGALLGMTGLLTLSRGGMASLVLGGGLLVILVLRSRRANEQRAQWGWAVFGSAAVLVSGFYVIREAMLEEFITSDDTTKLALWKAALPLMSDFLPLGTGRGAFIVAFAPYNNIDPSTTFTHPENLMVQLGSEWGILGGLAVLVLVGGVVYLVTRAPYSPMVSGAIAGAAALLAHNAVDFSLELPGLAVPFVAALAAATASRRSGWIRLRLPARPVLASVGVLVLAAAAAAGWSASRQLTAEEERLRAELAEGGPGIDERAVREAVARHPADYMVPYLSGVWAYRSGGSNPLPFLNRALERNPGWAPAHVYVARTLAAAGHHDQAMLEYRLAVRYDGRLVRRVADEGLRRWPTFAAIRPMVDVESPPLVLWDVLGDTWTRGGRPEEAAASDAALLARVPDHRPALIRSAKRALSRQDFDEARAVIAKLPPHDAATILLRARLAAQSESQERAVELLEEALRTRRGNERLLAGLAHHRERAGDLAGAREALDTWERIASRQNLSQVYLARARLEEDAGRHSQALHYYDRALSFGGGDRALAGVARVAEHQGELYRAMRAYQKLAASDQENSRAADKARELKSRIDRAALESALRER